MRIQYGRTTLELEVLNDGASVVTAPGPAGHGLIGMRERAALHGGQVETGPLLNGGFGVLATFPLIASAS